MSKCNRAINDAISGHVMPTLTSHGQKSKFAPFFNHLDQTKKRVPLTVPPVYQEHNMTERVMSNLVSNV